MSLLRTVGVQIGQDSTATNNFTLYQPAVPDGTLRLGNGNSGSVTDAITLNSSGNVGIGTSSLTYKLNVNSGANNTAASFTSTTGNGYLRISGDNLATHMTIGKDTTGTYIYSPASTPTRLLQGGNTRLNIDANGYITEPNKPLVFALNAPAAGTNPGSPIVLKYATVVENAGSHYNTTTGLFTCPVAGRYKVTQHCMVDAGLSAHALNVSINKNGGGVTTAYTSNTSYNQIASAAIVNCAANDTLSATLNHGGKHAGYDSFTVEFLG